MLSAAVLLSIAASAQDEIKHRAPEFEFIRSDSATYVMPAWDAVMSTKPNYEMIRLQALDPLPADGDKKKHIRAKIVAKRVFSKENNNYGSPTFAPASVGATSIPGNFSLIEGSKTGWTYKSIFGTTDQTNDHGETGIIPSTDIVVSGMNPYTIKKQTIDTLVIPASYKIGGSNIWSGYTFDIVVIGEGAFRNDSPSNHNVLECQTVIIPNTVEVIENNAFRHGTFTNVVFEEGSKIKKIEKATFEGCPNLEKINIPASVDTIEGTAFGACDKLKKIVFEGNVPTLTMVDEEPNYPKPATYNGPYNIFQGAQRFIKKGIVKGNVTPSECLISVNEGLLESYRESDPLWNEFYFTAPILKIGEGKKIITYCSKYDFSTSAFGEESGVKAYRVRYEDVKPHSVDTTAIEGSIARGEGVLISGEGGKTYNLFFPPTSMSVEKLQEGENMLVGTLEPTDLTDLVNDEDLAIYVLSNGEFHRSKAGTLAAGKAYLKVDATEEMPLDSKMSIGSKDNTTAINTVGLEQSMRNGVYDLQGRGVKHLTKGFYIVNGKKVIIK